jgi:radical SAM superfamily enzyme YgiQ (UPF0313 family)
LLDRGLRGCAARKQDGWRVRVLLINAPPHQRVDRYDSPDFTRLGLACLAAQLRADGVARVAIVDAKFERLSYDEVLERVRAFGPDLVGLTAFTNEIKPAARVARMVKRHAPAIRTVIGGVHVSAIPRETLAEFPEFDFGVVKEGEPTLAELVATLGRGGDPAEVANVVHREGGEVRCAHERDGLVDVDAVPMPAWDLLPPSPRSLFMTQRGCPYRCNFCANPNGRTVRARSIDNLIAELDYVHRACGARELYVCDEIFTVDRERTHRLLDAMIASGVARKLRWSAQVHVNTVDRDLFAKMKAAGCFICGLGIETGDADVLRRMGKGISQERVKAVRRMAADVGLPIEGLFILGHPNETWETAMRTVDFMAELNPERPILGVMVPFPGTEVARMARRRENGYRLISSDWNDYGKQIGDALEFEHLSRFQMELLQMIGYLKVFVANRRYFDLAEFVWDYRNEGWAVLRKLLGRKPPPFDAVPEPRRVSPYFDAARLSA